MKHQRCGVSAALVGILLLAGCSHLEIGLESPATFTSPVTATRLPIIATPILEPTSTSTPTRLPPTLVATEPPVAQPTTTPIAPSPTPIPTLPLSQIINFTVDPAEVNPGQSVTLRWTTNDAEAVDLDQYLPDAVSYSETLSLPLTGEVTQIILERERQWHVFELAATNAAGVIKQSITVIIRCPDTYFFSPLPEADRQRWDCPDGPAIISDAAEQTFENGRMLWTGHDQRIYVLLNDGTYRAYDDTWTAADPDRDPTLDPPVERYQPLRGFGKVWRTQSDVRDQLGWALAPERGFETLIQGGWIHCCSQTDTVNRPIYVRDLDGRIARLWAGEVTPGQWSVFTP